MQAWPVLTHYCGFDWASDHHDVIVVDKSGTIVLSYRFEHSAQGWQAFFEKTKQFPNMGVAIETCSGAAVEQLLAAGATVFPINPKMAKCYRGRKSASGVKTDQQDAWSMADALRLDGQTWRPLAPEDPLILELRQLCRDEVGFIQQRTALINQLQAALRLYYPAAIEAFEDWTAQSAWAFVEAFPTPKSLEEAGKRKWEKFLHAHKLYRPETTARRLEVFARATKFTGSESTIAAKSLQAVTTAKVLRILEVQLADYRKRIESLFEKHPDHDLFGSLPGAGMKIKPRLLGEIGADRARFEDAEGLQAYAGTAPVTFQSGKNSKARIRWACNKHLRGTVHFLADLSRGDCAWAESYYQKKKEEGHSHAAALRQLGNRWMKILWKMWQTRTEYDGNLHQQNQVKHGSWVIQLVTPATAGATI